MIEMNKIYNMDCLEFMKQVPDKYFDLVLTDPPYGIGASKDSRLSGEYKVNLGNGRIKYVKAKGYKKSEWDNEIPSYEIFKEIKRISKKQIIFGGNYFISSLENSKCWLVWDKLNGDNNNADCELAWTNFETAVRKYSFKWNGMLQQDMANKEERHHPTQKPVELFKMILRDYAIKNGYTKIFDGFMGSGTTAIACESLGLEWCGCELESDYVAIANKRLKQVQRVLF